MEKSEMTWLFKLGSWAVSLLTGGSLKNILATIDKGFDDEVRKEEIKADVTKTIVNAQANLLVGRTWWFQLFFVIPLGFWWTAVIVDSVFQIGNWDVAALPPPLDDWAAYIISALFIVDGGKALIGRFAK
jgi:hypothetical protein